MYEMLYIVSPVFTDVQVEEVKAKVEAVVTSQGGEIKSHKLLARLPLAYPIKKMKQGVYVIMYFTGTGEMLAKLDRVLRLEHSQDVLRSMVSLVTEEESQAAFDMVPYVHPLIEKEKRAANAPSRFKSASESPSPVPAIMTESPLSVEELDKKLDEILEDDTLGDI